MTTPPRPNASFTADLLSRLAQLSLEQKCRLLTGKSHWRLYGAPGVGLRPMVFADGPIGIHGDEAQAGLGSIALPNPSAVAATWDRDLARLAGSAHADEARRHGVDVILAPVVNLQRTPLSGRHFEYQSEDPLLSGDIACALIEGIQGEGIGTCVKHFVANDSETERTSYLARLDQRTLREVYLAPFERAAKDAGAWSLMAAYNRLDDGVEAAPMTAHHQLLTTILKDEWGYDGLVVSDWTAARSTVEPALAGLDLVMPGPGGPWSSGRLEKAVREGLVSIEHLDDKVLRLLLLASRVGAMSGYVPPAPAKAVSDPDELVRTLAARAVVVLSNSGALLPVADPAAINSVALIGPYAADIAIQGGGSALVRSNTVHSARAGFAAAFPNAQIEVVDGARAHVRPPVADLARLSDPMAELPGIHVEALAANGTTVAEATWHGSDIHTNTDLPAGAVRLRLTCDLGLPESGQHWVGLATPGAHSIWVNGELVDESGEEIGGDQVILSSQHRNVPFYGRMVRGGSARLMAEVQFFSSQDWGDFVRFAVLHNPPEPDPATTIAAAVERACAVDLPVVIVGTGPEVESEGWDRADLELPGDQNALVEAVLAACPQAVVVVNAGAPVVLPWLDRARTVLWTWFPGQEGGRAVADVLSGRTEPTGRLPWTLPTALADCPISAVDPVGDERVLSYAEGLDIGYRGWLRQGRTPARCFGYGLGWTTWEYLGTRVRTEADGAVVTVTIHNTGVRRGREVVQVYLSAPAGGVARPVRWLAGFEGVEADPGALAQVTINIPRRVCEVWDEASGTWVLPSGRYQVLVGRNVNDIHLVVPLDL